MLRYRWFFICTDSPISAFEIRLPFFFACKKGSDHGGCYRSSYDGLSSGRYSGTGSNLVALCFDGITDDIYAYDWILKMALTILTLSSGFIGGEVAPLFSIGSCLGYVLGPVFGFDPMFGAALGFASVFCSGSNTLLAAILVGVESFGYSMLPFFSVVCFVSFIFNFNNSIFTAQRVAFTRPTRRQRLKERLSEKKNNINN